MKQLVVLLTVVIIISSSLLLLPSTVSAAHGTHLTITKVKTKSNTKSKRPKLVITVVYKTPFKKATITIRIRTKAGGVVIKQKVVKRSTKPDRLSRYRTILVPKSAHRGKRLFLEVFVSSGGDKRRKQINIKAPGTKTPPPTPSPPSPRSPSNCHPSYIPCLPNLPGDALNCGDIHNSKKPIRVIGLDSYRLDGDRNGWGCE